MDLVISGYCLGDCTDGGQISNVPSWYELAVIDGADQHTYFAHIDTITVGFSDEGYCEVRVNRANVYRYTPGDELNSALVADSQQMYDDIVNMLSGGMIPVVTYRILAENGEILNAENTDKLRTETP